MDNGTLALALWRAERERGTEGERSDTVEFAGFTWQPDPDLDRVRPAIRRPTRYAEGERA